MCSGWSGSQFSDRICVHVGRNMYFRPSLGRRCSRSLTKNDQTTSSTPTILRLFVGRRHLRPNLFGRTLICDGAIYDQVFWSVNRSEVFGPTEKFSFSDRFFGLRFCLYL